MKPLLSVINSSEVLQNCSEFFIPSLYFYSQGHIHTCTCTVVYCVLWRASTFKKSHSKCTQTLDRCNKSLIYCGQLRATMMKLLECYKALYMYFLSLTPLPSALIRGTTFSLLIHCSTRGAPYCAPRQEDKDDTYRPKRNNRLTTPWMLSCNLRPVHTEYKQLRVRRQTRCKASHYLQTETVVSYIYM